MILTININVIGITMILVLMLIDLAEIAMKGVIDPESMDLNDLPMIAVGLINMTSIRDLVLLLLTVLNGREGKRGRKLLM